MEYAGFREDGRVLKWVRFCDFEFSHYLCDSCVTSVLLRNTLQLLSHKNP